MASLASDEALDTLAAPSGAEALAAGLAEAGPAELVAAVEALRHAVWPIVSGELATEPELLAPAADRLAHACAVLAGGVLADAGSSAPRAEAEPSRPLVPEPGGVVTRLEIAPRGPEGGPLWRAALDRELADGGRSGRPFALLLLDVDGTERLRLSEHEETLRRAYEQIGHAVRAQVRREDVLAHERDGRLWVISSNTGRDRAAQLADRLTEVVGSSSSLRGVPLAVSIGMAVYPVDGRDADALTAAAEEDMYAARAAGSGAGRR
jgi:diguanylate cyclase (GGDEF)-like protein